MAKVFLSYSRADAQQVQRIASALQDKGHHVWWDQQISGGSEFAGAIENALSDADVVVVAWSQAASKSPWVRDEAAIGRDESRLVPVTLDGSPPPIGFRQYQTIDFSGTKRASFETAVGALQLAILEKTGAATTAERHQSGSAAMPAHRRALKPRSWWKWALATGVLVLGVAAAIWWFALRDAGSDRRPMLAVLPFDNIGGDPQNAYFSAGVTEDISSRLSRVPGLRVISRSSAARFKEMGKPVSQIDEELGASAVLEGTVRRAGGRVRVVVQLVDVSDEEQLWSETYEHDLTDVFAIQSSIATRVAEALSTRLGSSERTRISRPLTANMAAYDEYLRGRYQFNLRTGESLQAAAEHFKRAVALQSDFAAAHSGLSDVYGHLEDYGVLDYEEAFPLAIASAQRAVRFDPESAEAQASLGHVFTHQRRFAEAEAHLRRAVRLDPSYATAQHWLGLLLRASGRNAEALAQHRIAQELDPVARTTSMNLGISLYGVGDYANAIRQHQRTLQLYPDHGPTLEYLSFAMARSGRATEAVAVRRKAMDMYVKDGLNPAREKAGMAEILALAGRPEEARRILAEAESKDGSVELDSAYMARGYAALGDVTAALRWIERAVSGEWSDLDTVHAGDPAFAEVRRDPRYIRLIRRIGPHGTKSR